MRDIDRRFGVAKEHFLRLSSIVRLIRRLCKCLYDKVSFLNAQNFSVSLGSLFPETGKTGRCRPECPPQKRSEGQSYQEIARIRTISGNLGRCSCIVSQLAFSYPFLLVCGLMIVYLATGRPWWAIAITFALLVGSFWTTGGSSGRGLKRSAHD